MKTETLAVHAGRADLKTLGVHALPIDLSSTYPVYDLAEGTASLDALVAGDATAANPIYSRLYNPTVHRFEQALAALEQAEAAVAFGSGMAALTAVLLARKGAGDHVLACRPIYGTSDHLMSCGLLGLPVRWVQPAEVADAINPSTALVIIETPANPTLELVDIAAVVKAAGAIPVLVDSTFATPVLQNPITLGARYVLHSATKFLGGHGDVIAGVIACSEADAKALRQVRVGTGGLLHPLAAYLLHRGLPTLPLRVERAQANAEKLVQWLQQQSQVSAVYFPGLKNRALMQQQMRGPGCVLAFELADGYRAAATVMTAVKRITPAVSLGSVDSLIQHPAGLTHRVVDEHTRSKAGIHASLMRMSVGIEHVDDLIADLQQAFRSAKVAAVA